MKINAAIQAVVAERELTDFDAERLQRLWNNRNKANHIILSVAHVNRNGTSRDIKVAYIHDNQLYDISPLVAEVCGLKYVRDNGGVRIHGGGMDMGFALLSSLYQAIAPKNSKESLSRFYAVQYPSYF